MSREPMIYRGSAIITSGNSLAEPSRRRNVPRAFGKKFFLPATILRDK
jgi:hypothetical protein